MARMVPVELVKSWVCVYPCYINVNRTAAQGRRLPKAKLEGCT